MRLLLGILSAFAFSVSCLLAQDSACGSLTSQYALGNYRNLSVGISNLQEFRDLALQPLLAQPRISGTAGNVLARTHIKTWMQAVGWAVTEDAFVDRTPYGSVSFSNVIATLNPGKARRLVLACHYDTKLIAGVRFVGAIDSAVPCSILMDAALRLKYFFMAKKNSTSDLTVQFLFLDGEEAFRSWSDQDSLYGARHLASKWAATRDGSGHTYLQGIEAFILLDLIGTADTHFKLRFQETAPVYNKMRKIEACLRMHNLLIPSQPQNALFTPDEEFSDIEDDHKPFYQKGVPVVHLITTPFPAVWHTGSDNINALDLNRIENLSRVIRVYLADLPL